MKNNIQSFTFVTILLLVIIYHCECKGGRGGSRGGGFGSKSSSSSSWFSKPSYSKPSSSSSWFSKPSYSKPSPSPSYSSYKPAPSYGWNVNKPYGPPPAYPGLNNRPVSYGSSPPAYSRSHYNPPSYYSKNYKYSGSNSYPNYGSTFGSTGLRGNTYIHNNYYGSSSGGSPFLTNALFYSAGMHHGHSWGGHSSYRSRSWYNDDDRRWRMTTKAPYFENKVPGSESILPAAAVVGAATAFGLISLLPLNVPALKPLMYCNATDVAQSPIHIDNNIYTCLGKSVMTSSCVFDEENKIFNEDNKCQNRTMECDMTLSENKMFCTNGTLLSRQPIVCNHTTFLNGTKFNETLTVLNCFEGELNRKLASFVPTTTTEAPVTTTTEKNLSLPSRIHVFLMKIVGREDVLEKITTTTTTTTTTDDPRLALKEDDHPWSPEAMTIPPETTSTTTTQVPLVWMDYRWKTFENGTRVKVYDIRVPKSDLATCQYLSEFDGVNFCDRLYKKVPSTTEAPIETTTTATTSTTSTTVIYTGGPYAIMKPLKGNETIPLVELNAEEYFTYKIAKVLGKEYFYDDIYSKVPFISNTPTQHSEN